MKKFAPTAVFAYSRAIHSIESVFGLTQDIVRAKKTRNIASGAFAVVAVVCVAISAAWAQEPGAIRIRPDAGGSFVGGLIDRIRPGVRLGQSDLDRYRRVFEAQASGDFATAQAETEKLRNKLLLGHVLYQRYTAPGYRASYAELASWMSRYADHPGARKIYDLAVSRRPAGAGALTEPRTAKGTIPAVSNEMDGPQAPESALSDAGLSAAAQTEIKGIQGLIAENPTAAARRLSAAVAAKTVAPAQEDALLAEIAQSYFYNGKADKAFEYGAKASNRAKEDAPLAGWIAGLSAWKSGRYEQAATFFARAANSKRSSPWMVSAGAHWAARAHLRARRPQEVSYWLARAAEHPRTFYGIISLKALGLQQSRFNWAVPELTSSRLRALSSVPAGARAVALIEAGRPAEAAAELRQVTPGDSRPLREAMIALSSHAGLPDMQLRMGHAFRAADGGLYDAALYPDAPWSPKGGFEVDRALVHAFIRQESKFDPGVNNKSSGAIGLMQLMPATAGIVAARAGMKIAPSEVQNPVVNIDLGQKYLGSLLADPSVRGNLFKLAVAYNAGPGKLARWVKSAARHDDPLLFVESIPVPETRAFVERVMTNFWIYRLKYGQGTESLDSAAAGEWPVYVAQDVRRGRDLAALLRGRF